ncbi:MAG: type I glyceraldehyde-3-phosphate dehydrogenase [Deltaproteobacteria bacterium]|nr:type I glyceraldehyde-3-phosphate dehydrogenase [Deltaproteobacteria bacterium]
MALRVAINGFGRIGRAFLRIAWGHPDVEIVHVNDLTSAEQLAHLLEYDSLHRRWNLPVRAVEGGFDIDGRIVAVGAEPDPSKLPWGEKGVDVVLESTGLFTARAKAQLHLEAGARRVIISAPAKDEDITVAIGVNEHLLDPGKHRIISNASCTTNCLAPVAKVLDEVFGIETGLMTTIHSYTMDQNLLDAPHRKGDFRRARAAALNMVPTTTGAAKAVGLVLPHLKGRLNGMSIRVPTPNVSLVDLVFTSRAPMTVEAVNAALTEAANGRLEGILGVTTEPWVSSDFVGTSLSSVADLSWTYVVGERTAKVLAWYDNEWGYATRLVDLARLLGRLEQR